MEKHAREKLKILDGDACEDNRGALTRPTAPPPDRQLVTADVDQLGHCIESFS
jgi:hypothetical protein